MVAQELLHGFRPENTPALNRFGREKLPDHRLQFSVDPLRQWRIETHLLLFQDLAWQQITQCLPGDPLRGRAPDLHLLRYPQRKLEQPVISKRGANLKRVRHRHAVSILQAVAAEE